jgi:hypothetical protein
LSVECPVCREPLRDRPERCFRCETRLAPWWDFEGALARTGGGEAAPAAAARAPHSRGVLAAAVLGELAFGVAAGWGLAGSDRGAGHPPVPHAASTVPPPPPAVPPALASGGGGGEAAPRRVTYRVQRGDSLWRIAKAFTGDGRRWRELWPERADGRLTLNEVLVIPHPPEQE